MVKSSRTQQNCQTQSEIAKCLFEKALVSEALTSFLANVDALSVAPATLYEMFGCARAIYL